MVKIAVILGTVRKGRFGEKPARWIFSEIEKHKGVTAEFVDLRDYDLPLFDEAASPRYTAEPYKNETVRHWTKKIGAMDGFIVVSPEYNHAMAGVMKNAFDWVYNEWVKKPIGFVSYGTVGGAPAVEQMRMVAVEFQMVPVQHAVHLGWELFLSMFKDEAPVDPARFAPVQKSADTTIEQVLWWARLLKAARSEDAQQAKAA